MNRNTPQLSVLVCTRNRPRDLARCVESILGNRFESFELLVVDQSDGDETARHLDSLADPRIRHLPSPEKGLSRARNLAITSAMADIVVFTDDDCICDPEWLEAIADEFQRFPDMSGLFGRVLPWGDRSADGLFCHCLIDVPVENSVAEPVPPHKHLGHGNNMAFRKDVFRTVGLYNPRMGAGTRLKSGEDTDLTYRALRQHLRLKYSPLPLVYHNNWNTFAQADRMDLGYVLGFVAVFGKFSLYGDRVARRCLRERLGELVLDLRSSLKVRDWKRLGRVIHKLVFFGAGLGPALYFRLRGDCTWEDASPSTRSKVAASQQN